VGALRLNRFLASCGLGSRRKCESLVLEGRVSLNGRSVTGLGTTVDPRRDEVAVDGAVVRPPAAKTYLLMNKPAGYLTTASDPQGRPTVMDLIPSGASRLFPVGRLDSDTTGLLLLTDDGKLAFRLAHPRYEIEKRYLALVEGRPTRSHLKGLRDGIELEDGLTRPAKVRLVSAGKTRTRLEIVIHEGRKRQVRRMMDAVGHPVLELTRTGIAFLELDQLKPGAYRKLKATEVRRLRREAGLSPLP
jgi:pseudouridine synthase